MKATLIDLTDEQFEEWVQRMIMEAERRGIIVKGTSAVYPKSLGGPVISALIKVQRKVWELDRNAVHKTRDLELTTSESSNFSTLRQAGLLAQVTDEDGKDRRGWWLITRKGGQFLRGEIKMPAHIHTMRNHPIKNQPLEPQLYAHEFKRDETQTQQYEDFVATMNTHVSQPTTDQMSLIE